MRLSSERMVVILVPQNISVTRLRWKHGGDCSDSAAHTDSSDFELKLREDKGYAPLGDSRRAKITRGLDSESLAAALLRSID